MSDQWPLRYRVGNAIHRSVNRVYDRYPSSRLLDRLNTAAAKLWVPWWVARSAARFEEERNG